MRTLLVFMVPVCVGAIVYTVVLLTMEWLHDRFKERGRTKSEMSDQSYYWTEAWQAEEREARADIAAGRVHRFHNAEDAVAWLNSDDEAIAHQGPPSPK